MLLKFYKKISTTVTRFKNTSVEMKFDKMAPVISCYDDNCFIKAVECLKRGAVIAVPTDTIYGLACNAKSPEAIEKLYTIKGRDSTKPVAICVTHIYDLRRWSESKHLVDNLLKELLPGPVTILLNKSKSLDNPSLNPHTDKIGLRIPNHSFINRLTQVFGMPLALTSANLSNEPSSLSVKEFEHLYDRLDAVFDGGVLSEGKDQNRTGSTIVDLSVPGSYKVIRYGISCEKIIDILNRYGLNESD